MELNWIPEGNLTLKRRRVNNGIKRENRKLYWGYRCLERARY
jgi:hypothetical protein